MQSGRFSGETQTLLDQKNGSNVRAGHAAKVGKALCEFDDDDVERSDWHLCSDFAQSLTFLIGRDRGTWGEDVVGGVLTALRFLFLLHRIIPRRLVL